MGIRKPILDFESTVLAKAGLTYSGLQWCELGNQIIREENLSAKQYYTRLGVNHTSIDLNGRDGALAINLDYPISSDLTDRFDVVTDYGTLEHVNNQYQAFQNIHRLCKANGIMLHVLPLSGHWEGHCRYYYDQNFALRFAEAAGYRLICSRVLNEFPYDIDRNGSFEFHVGSTI
ncbi:MAG: hypothetical protein OHK006_20980 [Thermodesulfovibrionales bacterium]